ncbi:histone-lysine N-methyltransferase, H3 lysine-79 specific-like isoform X2 [Metopolophium dirhodum]|nr:histone-lysine N-methyltransferase, H3 lysine-79 specific-like isoform X2 [Metopolophium dirhodum]
MTRTSIKIIYLTLLWTLTCPLLQCFSPPNPLNCIALLTSIQSLQAISLKVSEESYDKLNEALQNNPNLLNQLIAQSGSSKSKLSSLPQGVPLKNGVSGVSSIFPRFGTGMYSVKNPVTVALPKEVTFNGQKYVLTNRLQRLGNFFKKVTSAITSPISSSFNYLKNVGQNQGVLPDVLKSISNRLKIGNGNEEDEEEEAEEAEEEEEEEKPKKSKKKKSKKKNVAKKKGTNKKKAEEESEEEEEEKEEEEEEERPKKSKKKKKAEDEEDEEEKENGGDEEEEEKENEGDEEEEEKEREGDEEEEEERPNKSKKKNSKRKKEESDEEEGDDDEEKEKDDEEGDEEKEKDEDEDEED